MWNVSYKPPPHETFTAVVAAMIVGTAALMVLGIQPILLGALVEEGRIPADGLGSAATVEILAIAAGTCIGPVLMKTGYLRAKCAALCLMLAAINFGLTLPGFDLPIVACRAAAGALEGLSLSAAILIMTHNRRPDRLSGIFLGAQTIPQVISAYLLPTEIIPRWGSAGGFTILGILAAIAAIAALCLVDRVEVDPTTVNDDLQWSPAAIVISMAAFVQFSGVGAAWSYLERLAAQHGFSGETIGIAISGSLLCQVGGAWLAAWIGGRFGYRFALIAGSLLQAGNVIALAVADQPGWFISASCAFGLFWLAMQPFQIRFAIAIDTSRQLAVLLTPIAVVGLSAGPFLLARFAGATDLRWIFGGSSTLLLASALLYLCASLFQPRGKVIAERVNA